jgi:hypothetical protein
VSVTPDAADYQMHVRVLRIVMGDSDPFEICAQVHCHALDKLAS